MPGPVTVRSVLQSYLSAAALFLTMICVARCTHAQSAAAVARSARLHESVSSSAQTQLLNHVPAFADVARLPSTVLSPGSSFARLTLVVNRAPEVEAAFEQLLADQQNPSSPRYHQWLLPAQVGELYGPAQTDVDAIVGWLQSRGLQIVEISPSRTLITFSGSETNVATAFRTSFRLFNLANGETRYSLLQEPSVPSAIAPLVNAISGLSQVVHKPSTRHGELVASPKAEAAIPLLNSSTGSHYLVAGDFATAYDMNPAYLAGITGTGQHIAIAGESRVDAVDVSRLQTLQGQTIKQPTVYIPPTGVDPGVAGTAAGTGKDNSAQDEATLDVDRTTGNAPGATIDLVVSGDVNGGSTYATSGLFIAINYAIATLNDPILSISFGGCENINGASNTTYERSIFQTAASQGITTFVSSGDDGVASCNAFSSTIPTTQVPSINDLCAGEFVTCVGGTEFNDSTNAALYWAAMNDATNRSSLLSYIPEGAWNDVSVSSTGTYSYGSTGGGTSVFVARPAFQTGTGVPAGTFRLVPDVAFTSSTHDGFVTCLDYLGATCGSFFPFGGTSAAAPSMAAIQALANQKLGARQGNINSKIYAFAASNPTVFHDVTVASSGVTACVASSPSLCNNSTPSQNSPSGLAGNLVNAGYDEVTGWGSLDVTNYLAAVVSGPSFSLSPATASLSFTSGAGTANTNTIKLSSVNGFIGTVNLSCSISTSTAYYQPSCAVAPTSVTLTAGGTATAVVTIGSTTAVTTTQAHKTVVSSLPAGGAVLALLFFCFPVRRRRALRTLATLLLMASGLAALSGCGAGGNLPPVTTTHSSAGTYTVTVSGSGTTTGGATAATANTTFTVSIN